MCCIISARGDNMSYSRKKLGKFMKQIRQTLMYNQVDVANAVGITMQSYSKYENGLREPSVEVLFKIAEFYKVSPVLFLTKGDYPLSDEDSKDAYYASLSVIAANYEKQRWICERYLSVLQNPVVEVEVDSKGDFYPVAKNEKEKLQIKASLFRIYGDLAALKKDLNEEIQAIEEEVEHLLRDLRLYSS